MTDTDELIRIAEAASKRKDWPEAIKHWGAIVDRHGGPQAPKKFRSRLWRARQAQNSEQALQRNRLVFKALADASKLIRVNPRLIRYKVPPAVDVELYENAVLPGDWDLDVTAIDGTLKHRSLEQHFVHGVPWQDTALFGHYANLIKNGKPARGRSTMDELLEDYREVDALYEDMKKRGFALPEDDKRRREYFPHVHIGRTGEILYGRAGNHRLAIAKTLELQHIVCLVRARHADWQDLRERIFGLTPERRRAHLGPDLADHPDLADLIG